MHSVIIIGAGMAGVKTAIDLYQAGITNTLIIEATTRVGGRLKSIKSTKDPKVCYDLGALWFHDALKNPLFEKAKKLKNIEYAFDDGKLQYVSEEELNIPTWTFDTIVDEVGSFAQLLFDEDPSRADLSVRDLCLLYLEKAGCHLTSEQYKYGIQVVRMWCEMWNGILWDEHSAKEIFFGADAHYGRNAYVKSGYYNVFLNEFRDLPPEYRDHNILTNTQIKAIDTTNDDYVVLESTDGRKFKSEYLVLTVPLSTLALSDPLDQNRIEWKPELPPRFKLKILDFHFGSLGKVVMEFSDSFWPNDVNRFYVLASLDTSGGSTKAQAWQHPTLIVNYLSFSDVPSLVFLTQDPVSREIEEMSTEQIWQLFEPILAKIATGPIKRPHTILNTPWNNDQYTRGAYAVTRVGDLPNKEIAKLMASGLSPRVRFAGAETQPGSANGCAHGAWYSGKREAKFILHQMGMTPKI